MLGLLRRELMVQPVCIIWAVRSTTVGTATTPVKARAKHGVIHCTTCLALSRLRLGACQQPSRTCQCVKMSPSSLA